MRQSLNIRAPLSPNAIVSARTREVRALDGNLAMNELITLQEQVDRSTSPQKAALILLEVLGSVAVLLAGVGIYGVVSYAISQNSRELGLRMALGARAPDLLCLVISRCLLLSAGGIALGMAAALVFSRLLSVYLYGVSPRDPLAFGSATILMVLLALTASFPLGAPSISTRRRRFAKDNRVFGSRAAWSMSGPEKLGHSLCRPTGLCFS